MGAFGVFPMSRTGQQMLTLGVRLRLGPSCAQAPSPHFGTRGMGPSRDWSCPQPHAGGLSLGTRHCLLQSNLLRTLLNKLIEKFLITLVLPS